MVVRELSLGNGKIIKNIGPIKFVGPKCWLWFRSENITLIYIDFLKSNSIVFENIYLHLPVNRRPNPKSNPKSLFQTDFWYKYFYWFTVINISRGIEKLHKCQLYTRRQLIFAIKNIYKNIQINMLWENCTIK